MAGRKNSSQIAKSAMLETLGNNPKALANWLLAKALGNLVERVEAGAHLTEGQVDFLLKSHRTLQEGEIFLGADEDEVDEMEVVAELPTEKLRWLMDHLN